MAHVLRVVDGVTTINLADGVQILGDYRPMPGDDGEEIRENVRVTFVGASQAANLTAIRALNDLFKQAKRYKDYKVGRKVFVEFDKGTTGVVARSLLTGGEMETNKDTLDSQWANSQVEVEITWTRMAGWELPEVEIPLGNTSGSGTGGRAVTNHNNAAYENWVKILAADITGDMPARLRLQLTHTYATNPFMNTIYVHHKVDNVTTFVHMLEGESGTGGTNTADANASGGSKKAYAWAVTTKEKLCEWTLSSAFFDAADHSKYQLMVRIDPVAYTDLYLQFMIKNQTGYTLVAEGALTPVPAGCMFSLDTLRLPPGQTGGSNAPMILELWAQRLSAGAHALALDFIQFSPVADESWRKYICVDATGGLRLNELIVDDGIENQLYRTVSALRIPDWSSKGGPLLLQPGRDQKLYFLAQEVGGAWRKLQTFTVRAYYRPRTRVL